jgi:hypothetical protein
MIEMSKGKRMVYMVMLVIGVFMVVAGSVLSSGAKDQEIPMWMGIPLCQAYGKGSSANASSGLAPTDGTPPGSGLQARFVSRNIAGSSDAVCPPPESLADPDSAEVVTVTFPLSDFRDDEYYPALLRSDNSIGRFDATVVGTGVTFGLSRTQSLEASEVSTLDWDQGAGDAAADFSASAAGSALWEVETERIAFQDGVDGPVRPARRRLLKSTSSGSSTSSSKTSSAGRTVSSSSSAGRSYHSRRGGATSRYTAGSPRTTSCPCDELVFFFFFVFLFPRCVIFFFEIDTDWKMNLNLSILLFFLVFVFFVIRNRRPHWAEGDPHRHVCADVSPRALPVVVLPPEQPHDGHR